MRNTIYAVFTVLSVLLFSALCFYAGEKWGLYNLFRSDYYWIKQYDDLPDSLKSQVESLINGAPQDDSKPYIVPHAFWYHALNPANPQNSLNSMFFRSREVTPQELKERPLIVAVGDSTTENWRKPKEESYPYLLEGFLAANSAKSPVVLNAGVGSLTSNLVASMVINRIIHLNPRIVIIKVGYNDQTPLAIKDITTFDYTNIYARPYYMPQIDANLVENAKLSYKGKVDLAYHIKYLSGYYHATAGYSSKDFDLTKNQDKYYYYEQHVASIIGALRANGIRPVLLDLPYPRGKGSEINFKDINTAFFIPFCDKLNVMLIKVAQEQKVPLVQTAENLMPSDFWDACHLNKSGNEKIARKLAPVVTKMLHETN